MEPRDRFREASRARHAKAAEEERGGEEEKEGVVPIQEEIIPEIGSRVGSKAKQVTARNDLDGVYTCLAVALHLRQELCQPVQMIDMVRAGVPRKAKNRQTTSAYFAE